MSAPASGENLAATLAVIGAIFLFAVLLGVTGLSVWLYLRSRRPGAPPLSEIPRHERVPLSELIPESKFIEVDGARIHYVQAGEGSDIVLLHGIGASVFIWRFLFPLLQPRHRVTAIDLPGFGKSDKNRTRDYGLDAQCETVAKMLAAIGIGKPILVGSSMGGAISLWMALKYPESFTRVVGLAPATDFSLVPPAVQMFGMAAPLLRRALNRRSMKTILARVLSRHQLITDAVVEAYLAPFQDKGEGVSAFWSALKLLSDRRLPAGLKNLSADVLILYGENDLIVPRASMRRLLEILPNAKYLTHAEAGHHVMEDEPGWTAHLIEEFASAKK